MSALNKILVVFFFVLIIATSVELYLYFNPPKTASLSSVRQTKTINPPTVTPVARQIQDKASFNKGLAVSEATKQTLLSYFDSLRSGIISDMSFNVNAKGRLTAFDTEGHLQDGTAYRYKLRLTEQGNSNTFILTDADMKKVHFLQQIGGKETPMNPYDLKVGDAVIYREHINLINPDDPNTNRIDIIYQFPSIQ